MAHQDSTQVLSAEFTSAFLTSLQGGPESWINVHYTRSFKLHDINDGIVAAALILALLYYVEESFQVRHTVTT